MNPRYDTVRLTFVTTTQQDKIIYDGRYAYHGEGVNGSFDALVVPYEVRPPIVLVCDVEDENVGLTDITKEVNEEC